MTNAANMSAHQRVPSAGTREITAGDRSIAFLIFGFLLACYLFTYTGVIQSSDGLSMFAVAESVVRRGELDTNQLLWMGVQQGDFGPSGDLFSRKGQVVGTCLDRHAAVCQRRQASFGGQVDHVGPTARRLSAGHHPLDG